MQNINKFFSALLLVIFSYGTSANDVIPKPDTLFDSLEKNITTGDSSLLLTLQNEILIAQKNGDSLTCSKAYYVLGKYYLIVTFNYPSAYNYFFRAFTIFEKFNDIKGIAKCEMQLGVINYLQRNFDEATNYFLSAYSKMVIVKDSLRIARLAYLLGLTYSEKHEKKKAYDYLKVAEQYANNSTEKYANREYLYGMGIYYLNLNDADSALYYLLPLLNLAGEEGYDLYGADLAKAWWLKGDPDKTKFFANKVIEGNRNKSVKHAFITCYYLLYQVALKKNDYKSATNYLDKYVVLKDSMINEKNLFNIASMKMKFLLEKELHERDILEAKKDAAQQAMIDKQKRQKNVLIVCSIFILIFLISFIYANNLKKRKNQQLAQSLEKLKSTQVQLVHHEKLASMGRLSAGIAHEMRNPLNFVNNFSEVTAEILEEMDKVHTPEERALMIQSLKNNVSKIGQHGKRAESIVKQIIEHVHSSTGTRELTDINHLCDSYLKIVLQSMSMNKIIFHHQLNKNYNSRIPQLSVNPHEMGRVFINIFTNAFQAIEEKLQTQQYLPEITINTSFENKMLYIEVIDNGNGIMKEHLKKVADPFFTTRPPGKGAGLGLSVAHDITRSYGGDLIIHSEPGVFTSVKIQLPA